MSAAFPCPVCGFLGNVPHSCSPLHRAATASVPLSPAALMDLDTLAALRRDAARWRAFLELCRKDPILDDAAKWIVRQESEVKS